MSGEKNALGALGLLVGVGDLVAQQHQHDGGRDDLSQRARRCDRAGCQARIIAALEHGRQGEQAHGDDGGADNAGRSGQQGAHDHNGNAQAAAHRSEECTHGLEQFFGDLGLFQHHAHEDEERDGHQDRPVHLHQIAVDALREGAEMDGVELAQGDADQGEGQRHASQGEGHRIAA